MLGHDQGFADDTIIDYAVNNEKERLQESMDGVVDFGETWPLKVSLE